MRRMRYPIARVASVIVLFRVIMHPSLKPAAPKSLMDQHLQDNNWIMIIPLTFHTKHESCPPLSVPLYLSKEH